MRETMMAVLLLGPGLLAACFPSLPPDVDDVEVGGQDTTTGGDTEPQPDTPPGGDTVAPPDGGECVGAQDCAHLAGTCVRLVCLDGTCATQPDTGAACDDGDPCTKGDACEGYTCAGEAYGCDDGEECTDDVCDGEGGCTYPAKAGHCFIGGTCYAAGETRPDDPCRVCEAGQAWSPNDGVACDDGDDVCTIGDVCLGTECVPGGPPDDTVGDWAMNVVKSVAPQLSIVQALHPAGLGHWVFIAETSGGGVVQTTQADIDIVGDQVVALRRAPASTYIQLRTEGFQRARLAASDDWNGYLAIAVQHRGTGTVHVGGTSHVLESDGEIATVIDTLGVVRWTRSLGHDVDSAALLADGALAVSGTTSVGLAIDGAGYIDVASGDESNPFVVRYGPTGQVEWVGSVSTPNYWTAAASLTATTDGGFAVALPFRGAATVRFPGGEHALASSSPNTTYGLVRVDAQGTILAAIVPFALDFEPQGAVFASPPPIFFHEDDVIVQLLGKLQPNGVVSNGSMSLARLDWDGAIQWGRVFSTSVTTSYSAGGALLGAVPGGTAFELADHDGTVLYSSSTGAPVSLYRLTAGGDLDLLVDYPQSQAGVAYPVFVRVGPVSGGLGVAGLLIGTDVQVHPTNHGLTLSGGGDLNAWGGYFDSASGLSCGAVP